MFTQTNISKCYVLSVYSVQYRKFSLYGWSHLVLIITQRSGNQHLHFRDEKTETRMHFKICLKLRVCMWQGQNPNKRGLHRL